MSRIKNGAIISYIFLIVESVSSMILTPLLVKYLGNSEYGIYGLAATVSSYILLLDLGVGNALTRYFSKYRVNNDEHSQRKLLGVSIIFYAVASSIALILLTLTISFAPTLFSKGLTNSEITRAKEMFWVVGINAVVTLIESPYKRMIIAYERFVLSKTISLCKVCLRLAITSLVLINGGMGVAVLLISLSLTILCTLFEMVFVTRIFHITPEFRGIDKAFFKEIFSYSSIILLQMIAVQINAMVDQVSISILIPSATIFLAIYNVGITITHYYQNIGGAINSLLMPSAVKAVETNSSKSQLLDMMVKFSRAQISILGLLYIGFIVCGKDFITLWVGDSKINAYWTAFLIMLPQLFYLTQSIGVQLLWALNKHKTLAVIQLCVAVTNIGLTAFLVSVMDPVIGASIGTSISSFAGNVIAQNFAFKKGIGISLKDYYTRQYSGLLPALFGTMIAGLALHSIIKIDSHWIRFLSSGVFMVILYAVFLLLFGLNQDEKQRVLKMLRRN